LFTDNDTRDHGRQRVHISVKITAQFAGVKALDKFFNLSVSRFAVAHKASILNVIGMEA
jgi:hypothetical protein